MAAFSLKDSVVTFTAGLVTDLGIVPIGAPFRIKSHTKVSVAPGGKTSYLKGADMLPIDILVGTAEPKVEIECSDGREVWSARDAMGGIGSDMIVSLTFQRIGMIPVNFLFSPAKWGDGGGIDLDETKGAGPDKIMIPCTDILQDLVSIYNRQA